MHLELETFPCLNIITKRNIISNVFFLYCQSLQMECNHHTQQSVTFFFRTNFALASFNSFAKCLPLLIDLKNDLCKVSIIFFVSSIEYGDENITNRVSI